MATNNMHNLTTLIKRLEAATLRLEDIASSTVELPQAVPGVQQPVASPPTASQTSTPGPPPAPSPAPQAAPPEDLPESIEEFDSFIGKSVDDYVKQSEKLGGLIAEQAANVLQGFREQRKFLLISTKAKKPDLTGSEMAVFQDLLKPINEALMAVGNLKESNRGSPVSNQLSTVAEGIMVLAWVTVDNKPWKHVDESLGSAQFFGNRVLKEHKDKDAEQVAWIQSFYQIFKDLTEYIKQYFPNGVTWNPKGLPAKEVAKTASTGPAAAAPPAAPAPPAGGLPPPPPPPGPPPVLQIKEQSAPAPSAQGGLNAVFSELNQGDAVTKGLRKVDKSEMTHKNPSLRANSTVSSDSSVRGKSPAPARKPKPESMRVKKPPKKELDGNKWTIENFEKHPEPIEIECEISHSVLISKCNHTTIILKGKANAVTVENTNRLSLVVDSLVSTVDAVKSANFAVQVLGTIPTMLLDQIDGAQVYLSKESTGTRVFSSKSASINLNVLAGGEGDEEEDYKEVPLPSQICSYFDKEKGDLINEIVDHASG